MSLVSFLYVGCNIDAIWTNQAFNLQNDIYEVQNEF